MSANPQSIARHPDVTAVELIGGVEERSLTLLAYDPKWPSIFKCQVAQIRTALGSQAVSIEHIGSTSVPALVAKPIVDILVTVADITAEEDYLAPLLKAGYELRVREPGHRMVRTPALNVHIHLLENDHPSVNAYLMLRNRLRSNAEDRELYAHTKRELMSRGFSDMNAYADAKTWVIEGILSRAQFAPQS